MPRFRAARPEAGMVLLAVLMVMLVVAGSSASFIWFMNQQQTRAGARHRSAAALAAGEAGIHRALSVLETVTPEGGPGRTWRPAGYVERLRMGPIDGQYTISIADDADGAVVVTSVGEVAGVARRVRARVRLASPALLAALYGAGFVRIEQPPAAVVILPYGEGLRDRPWVHIAAGQGLWFATSGVAVNDPAASFGAGPGPVDPPEVTSHVVSLPRPGPVRLLLARGANLALEPGNQNADLQQLRTLGAYIDGVVMRPQAFPALPEVDRAFYRARAAANTDNVGLNEAAGQYAGDRDLARKRDGVYSAAQFERLRAYLSAGRRVPVLRGMIYVMGGLVLEGVERLTVADGALIAEGTVQVSGGASLEITHTAVTRTLPGLVVLDGALVVTGESRLRAHGLVYASRIVDAGKGAYVDIVGNLLAGDGELSFNNFAATVVIRYDPAVLGTSGLRLPASEPVIGWVDTWEELP